MRRRAPPGVERMPSADAPFGSVATCSEGCFGVVGLGRMALALLLPLIEAGLIDPAQVQAAVASPDSARRLAADHGLAVATDAAAAWRCPTVLLAVKPQQLDAVAGAYLAAGSSQGAIEGRAPTAECEGGGIAAAGSAPTVGDGRGVEAADNIQPPLLISVLAGVRLERLQRLFPGWRCVRAVPNTPALVGAGLTGLAWGEGIDLERRSWVRSLFERVGEVLELPEGQLDPFLALTSSGPAFLALVVEAMADGAVAAGLPRAQAQHLAHRTMAGTAALLQGRQLHPGQLKDMVSSPGGTTIAGLRELERCGLRSALIEAVIAAAQRSRELA
jgi:pyrroline-5-carboxylate reductase